MPEVRFKRNTRQRQVILEVLKAARSHPTAQELHERIKKRLPKISLGTVYRNLELLAEMGKINKLKLNGPEARFDGVTERHFHIRCVSCNHVADFDYTADDMKKTNLESTSGYKILDCNIEFTGICPDCRK